MTGSDPLDVTRQVTTALDALGVPYVIGGSFASMVHGMVRATMDADIIADLRPDHAAALIEALGEAFYTPGESTMRQEIERRGSFNLIHLASMFKIDIFLPGARPFDRQQLDRRISQPIGRRTADRLWILTPEDIILAKLEWFRRGGEVSERQWRDVLGVIMAQSPALDVGYLREWAAALQVGDLLARALAEAAGSEA